MKYRDLTTVERVRELVRYEPDSGNLVWITRRKGQHPPGSVAGTLGRDGYIKVRIDGLTYQAHRLIWLWFTGAWPENEIDHINLDKSDNRWCNLRPATHMENMINVRVRRDGLKGAYFDKKKKHWYSNIRVKNKQFRIGTFSCEMDAHLAYCRASKEYHGEFSRTS